MKTIKVKVTTELELPINENNDVYKFDAHGFVHQAVFDNFTHYPLKQHLIEATKWLGKSKGVETSTEYQIYRCHETWADILEKASVNTKVEIID